MSMDGTVFFTCISGFSTFTRHMKCKEKNEDLLNLRQANMHSRLRYYTLDRCAVVNGLIRDRPDIISAIVLCRRKWILFSSFSCFCSSVYKLFRLGIQLLNWTTFACIFTPSYLFPLIIF